MRGSLWFPLAVALAAACARTGLLPPTDDDAVQLGGGRGGTATNGLRGGRTSAGGAGGFVGVGGTAAGDNGGVAGSGLTQAGRAGSAAGDAGEAGFGGEAGAPVVPDCVLHVAAATGNDANQGQSWDHAVATVTRALALAGPDCEVWIAGGTYTPTSGTDRDARFRVPQGVALRGGFAGHERAASERDLAAPLPILTGNIGSLSDQTDNAHHVVVTQGDATFDHLQISDGYADDALNSRGAAIAAAGHLTLDGCTVSASYAQGDGGAVIAHGPLTVTDSTFVGNSGGNHGGAIYVDGGGATSIERAVFQANVARYGGALYLENTGDIPVTVTKTSFEANVATYGGGALVGDSTVSLNVSESSFDANVASTASAIESGGPLALYDTTFTDQQANSDNGATVHAEAVTTVTRCQFVGNHSGALVVEPDRSTCSLSVALTGFSSNSGYRGGAIAATACDVTVTGSNFSDNVVEDYGGAIYVESSPTGVDVDSSDFSGNSAAIFGGAVYVSGGNVVLSQSNFTANTAPNGGAVMVDVGGLVTASNCTFQQNAASSVGGALFTRSTSTTQFVSTLLAKNTAGSDAAAVYCADATLVFRNATVADNVADSGAAVSALGPVIVYNSIFWNDTASEFALATTVLTSEGPEPANLAASNLSGTYPTLTAFDPKFVASANADYRLSADSACIDNAEDSAAPTTDITGSPRVSGHQTPCPSCRGIADMGAYEYHP